MNMVLRVIWMLPRMGRSRWVSGASGLVPLLGLDVSFVFGDLIVKFAPF